MKTPMDILLDGVSWTCGSCGKPMGNGQDHKKCWVTLRCPSCNETQPSERLPEDGDREEIELECPDCEGKQS